MRRFKKTGISIVVVLLVIYFGGSFIINKIRSKGLTSYSGIEQLNNLEEEVNVFRDSLGIPHVFAKNEKDLYRVTGYLLAQDRLWQMDLFRRATTGRLAEIFGEDLVETDILMRSLRIEEKSKLVVAHSDNNVLNALEAFSDGVNQYMNKNGDNLPFEFTLLNYKPEPWQPIHTVNLIGYMSWDLTMSWDIEVVLGKIKNAVKRNMYFDLIPEMNKQEIKVYPDYTMDTAELDIWSNLLAGTNKLKELGLDVFFGSNNWAVSSAKSQTGKPILANDMHLGLFAPGLWYQMHQVVEGKLDVTGLVLPGQPFVICGHNDSIAWGMTNVMLDDIDFYRETISEDSTRYLFNGQWRDLETINENVKIKGGDVLNREIKYTHRGPVISGMKDVKNEAISMRWIGNEYSNELRTIYLLNRADNWLDFKNAVKTFISISQNIAYADVNGNIGLYCCAGIPIRKGDGLGIFPGDTNEYDWNGIVSFDKLPHSYNPERGFVASANNKPVDDDYPYFISYWYDLPPRIERIHQLLNEKERLSVNDFAEIQTDQVSALVSRLKPGLVRELNRTNNTKVREIMLALEEWDGDYHPKSYEAAAFEVFYQKFIENSLKDDLGDTLYQEFMKSKILVRNFVYNNWMKRSSWYDISTTPDEVEGFSDIVLKSMKETVSMLSKEYGNRISNWQWGKIHQLTLKHPIGRNKLMNTLFKLNKGPYPVGGSFHTIAPFAYKHGDPFNVTHGASHRHVYSLDDWNRSLTVIPTGISGIPASPHYCDQTEMYLEKAYHQDVVDRDLIMRQKMYEMVFKPVP